MRKYPRIEIDQKAFDGLQIESVLNGKTVRDIATNAILGYISKEAKMVLDHKTYEDTKPNEPPQSRTRPQAQAGRPKQLAKDEAGIARVKELWQSGMAIADIARDINRPRQTVQAFIDRLIKQKELAERPKMTP
jgi:hypothetical protein